MEAKRKDTWSAGKLYEPYVGRWSRLVAEDFLDWLNPEPGWNWIDVGCGTGALSETILAQAHPHSIKGVDSSAGFVAHALAHVVDARAAFEVGDAQALPVDTGEFDVAVAGLVLNFVPDPAAAVREMTRAAQRKVAAYVWDYAERMELMRHFWDAAAALDPRARELDEGRRFPLCRRDALSQLFEDAGLESVTVCAIDVPTRFRDFDDYWTPFLGGQGPAPGYAMSLDEEHRKALRDRIRDSLPVSADGSIQLMARAWAVRGRVPD